MRASDRLIGLAVFGFWSTCATASSDDQIYTAVPPRPAVAVTADDARGAAVAPFGYDARLRIYTGGRAAPLEVEQPADAAMHGRGRGTRATQRGWMMRGHDPRNTGNAAASGPAMQAVPAWTFRPDPTTFVWRPASAPDGTIYVTTVSFPPTGVVVGRLYALHPDGSLKWQTELTNASGANVWTSATPVIDGAGNIYIAWAHDLNFGSLTAIALDSAGNVRWRFEPQFDLQFAAHHQPVLGDGVLYAAIDTSFRLDDPTHRASIVALDAASGNLVWHWISPHLDTFFDGPAVGRDGHVYHVSAANDLRGAPGHLYRIRPDGGLDWAIDIGAGANAPPAVDAQNNVYVGDLIGVVSKRSAAGIELWTYDTTSGQIFTSPAVNGTRVTVASANAGLHVLDAETGALDTVLAPDKFPLSQASDRAGNAFFYTFDPTGTVFGFGRQGRPLWAFNSGAVSSLNAVAIAADGRLLVGNSQALTAYVTPTLGDLNCDHAVDRRDIAPYLLALADPARYAQRYPQCPRDLADVNGDGDVNGLDTLPFLRLLN